MNSDFSPARKLKKFPRMTDSSDDEMEDLIDNFFDSASFNKPFKPYIVNRIENIVTKKAETKKPQTMERKQGGLSYVQSSLSSIKRSVTEVRILLVNVLGKNYT